VGLGSLDDTLATFRELRLAKVQLGAKDRA
jgi:hypothetical protein